MTYTPIGVIREQLRAEIRMDTGVSVTGTAHHGLIETHPDHPEECNVCRGAASVTHPGPRPPFAWAGGAR